MYRNIIQKKENKNTNKKSTSINYDSCDSYRLKIELWKLAVAVLERNESTYNVHTW